MRFDTAPALVTIDALGEAAWQPHYNTQYYAGDWSGVALRSRSGAIPLYTGPAVKGVAEGEYAATPELLGSPALLAIVESFACPVTSVRLLRLGCGATIKEHQDYGIGLDFGQIRVHVPLRTNAAVEFLLDGKRLDMEAGSCWYLDVSKAHSVRNDGDEARIHLVLDCAVDDWLRAQLAASPQPPKSTERRG